MTPITPLMSGGYPGLTHAMVLMGGDAWTPDSELTTALDFALGSKVVGTGEHITARAQFVLDAPAAVNGPYKMRLELLKADGSRKRQSSPESRWAMSTAGMKARWLGSRVRSIQDRPARCCTPFAPRLKTATARSCYEYYRTFWIIPDLGKRTEALTKTLELLSDQRSPAALEARDVIETLQVAHRTYYAPGFQGLTGFVFTGMRAAGLGAKEPMDFEAGLTRATFLATSLKEGR